MNKKYVMFKEKEYDVLYRIRALRDFGDVKAGDIGGYVKNEFNLSHDGDCWVYGNARVYGNAWVSDNAWVFDNAWVSDNARVTGYARVFDNAQVFGNALVYGNARVYDNAEVFDKAQVFDNARVTGYARVFGNAQVFGNALVFDKAQVSGDAEVYGNTWNNVSTDVYDNTSCTQLVNNAEYINIDGEYYKITKVSEHEAIRNTIQHFATQ